MIAPHGMLYYFSLFFMGVAVFIVANAMFTDEEKYKTSENLDEADGKNQKKKNLGPILNYSRPFFKRYISPIVSSMKSKQKIRNKYKKSLANAGLIEDLSADDFYSFKLFLILAFPIIFLAVRQFGEFYDWPLAAIPAISVFGLFFPDLWMSGRIGQRQREVLMCMPFIVDMLALSVEAGLDFMAAISKVVDKAPPSALSEEFLTLLKEIKIGSSRAEALRAMAWRINMIEISSFCATLIAADSVGASIGPILKQLSGEMRQKRSSEIEKMGAKAATKILFPMLFLIVPAVFVVIASPIILEVVYGGG